MTGKPPCPSPTCDCGIDGQDRRGRPAPCPTCGGTGWAPAVGGALHLTLPLPPSLTNSGKGRSRHWRSLEKEKTAYWETLDLLQMTRQIPRPPPQPFERAAVSATLYLWNEMDEDGAMARMKWLLDWLRKRGGFIVDDRRKNLQWAGLPEQVIDRRRPRVELVLTPLDGPNLVANSDAD